MNRDLQLRTKWLQRYFTVSNDRRVTEAAGNIDEAVLLRSELRCIGRDCRWPSLTAVIEADLHRPSPFTAQEIVDAEFRSTARAIADQDARDQMKARAS